MLTTDYVYPTTDCPTTFQEALGAGKTVFELAQRTPELKEPAAETEAEAEARAKTNGAGGATSGADGAHTNAGAGAEADASLSNAISFSDVHFAYPTRPTAKVRAGLTPEPLTDDPCMTHDPTTLSLASFLTPDS